MRPIRRLIPALALASALPATATAQICGQPGYPLGVTASTPETLDSTYLAGVARSFAYRWQVPSERRPEFALWRRVRNRVITPEPRWADDHTTVPSSRGQLLVTILKNGRMRAADPVTPTGDEQFDRTLRTIATDPLPGAPELPAFPAAVPGDSIVVRVTFGGEPDPGAAVVRFASAQTAVGLIPGSLNVNAPRNASTPSASERTAVIKYDVNELGTVPPASIQILESSDRELANAIRDGLMRARFRPATSNCRPITMTVLQKFGP